MLASAVAGRPVEVVGGEPGERAWSDGHTITLDPSDGSRRTTEAVVVQAALIAAGSLSRELMNPLLRRQRLRRRFLSIEGPRAVAQLRDLLPRSLSYMVCDDIAMLSDSPAASLTFARTREAIPESGLYLGVLRPREILSALRRDPVPRQARELGEKPGARDGGGSAHEKSTRPVPNTQEPDDTLFFPAGNAPTLAGRLLRALLRGAGLASSAGPVGGHTTFTQGAVVRDAASPRVRGTFASESVMSLSHSEFRYPEWDSRMAGYRPDWCTVRVVEPDDDPRVSMTTGDLGLRRPLSRLGTGPHTRHRQPDGDDIDIDAAIEHRVGAHTAWEADEAFYLATVRDRRDLSALILLDVSGSTGEPGTGRIRVLDHQRVAVAALATTMHRLGDRVAVYAFASHGRRNVRLTPLKTFAEYSDRSLLMRLHDLQPSGYSRLGAAIRHGATMIEQDGGTTRRLLIVVPDGLAFDHGYDLDHGARDVRRALAEVRGRGTGCLCLTVGATGASEELRLIFGTAAHASVPRPDQLAPVMVRLCRVAMRSAEVRRQHTYQKGPAI
jgi:hypothetical protein